MHIERFETIDSTQHEARRRAAGGKIAQPLLLIAERQTGGVGRLGRAWSSPSGGLWCTLALPQGSAAPHPSLGVRAGMAVLRAIDEVSPDALANLLLKWPNDLVIDGRKVAGVLVEVIGAAQARVVLIGVGVNANFSRSALPSDLGIAATTLREELGHDVDLAALASVLTRRLMEAVPGGDLSYLERAGATKRLHGLASRGTWSCPDGSRIAGTLRGLDEQGRAVVGLDNGSVRAIESAEW